MPASRPRRTSYRASLRSEDIDVLVHAAALVLRDALGDPHNVTDLLLLELHERVVHAVVELLLKRQPVEVDFQLEELVLDGLVVLEALVGQQAPEVGERVDGAAHCVLVGGLGEARRSLRVEQPDRGVQLLALLQVEVGVERVDRNVDRPSVRLELQDAAHHLLGRAAHVAAEGVKVLQVCLVQRVADDLNVQLIEVIEREAIAEVGTEWRVYQDQLIELGRGVGRAEHRHRIKHAERVALLEQLGGVAVVVCARDHQHHVVDHVPVRDVVHERRERFHCLDPEEVELLHQLLRALLGERRRRDGGSLVLQKVAISVPARCIFMSARRAQADASGAAPPLGRGARPARCARTVDALALAEVGVISRRQDAAAEPPEDGLEVAIVDVGEEHGQLATRCHLVHAGRRQRRPASQCGLRAASSRYTPLPAVPQGPAPTTEPWRTAGGCARRAPGGCPLPATATPPRARDQGPPRVPKRPHRLGTLRAERVRRQRDLIDLIALHTHRFMLFGFGFENRC
mmetsp:Transcript_37101/g.98357  ORF Transcript_37101/g.98357 Transcript_37101/m.98357 type:complete len:515 (-) Transcript_37101:53-1597(-)